LLYRVVEVCEIGLLDGATVVALVVSLVRGGELCAVEVVIPRDLDDPRLSAGEKRR
jgi:hypothetical protein